MRSEERFSNRVDDYVRARPGYPLELLEILRRDFALAPGDPVADLGSGTGILSRMLLDFGCTVYGVEPNEKMAMAARRALSCTGRFVDVRASAEGTGLAAGSLAGAIAAQAFHWFDPPRTRAELLRILRPGGWAALVWNMRRVTGTPFLEEYEALLQDCPDYAKVSNRWAEPNSIRALFAPTPYATHEIYNEQQLDEAGLASRAFSSSYVPAEGHPDHERFRSALADLFARHQRDGLVTMSYDTMLFVARLR